MVVIVIGDVLAPWIMNIAAGLVQVAVLVRCAAGAAVLPPSRPSLGSYLLLWDSYLSDRTALQP